MKAYFFLLILILAIVSCAIDQPQLGSRRVFLPFQQQSAGPLFQPPPPTAGTLARDSVFPYDLIPDTLTAVTCNDNPSVGGKPFTLAMGAYKTYGLQLSSDFLKHNDIKKSSPPSKVRQFINKSPFKKAKAQLAFLNESNLRPIVRKPSGAITDDFPAFDNPDSLNLLSQQKAVFTSRSVDRRAVGNAGKFQASLDITNRELLYWAPQLGENSRGNLLLAMIYSFEKTTTPIYYSTNRPYGRSYKLNFQDPFKVNYLTSIREENLIDGKNEGRWNCPQSLRFMIHRSTEEEESPFDREKKRYEGDGKSPLWRILKPLREGYCKVGRRPTRTESDFFLDIFGTDKLNHLPFELGDSYYGNEEEVDRSEGPCIKFKGSRCYGGDGFYRIEFDPNKQDECKRINQIFNSHAENENNYRICPAYLSICYRD